MSFTSLYVFDPGNNQEIVNIMSTNTDYLTLIRYRVLDFFLVYFLIKAVNLVSFGCEQGRWNAQ